MVDFGNAQDMVGTDQWVRLTVTYEGQPVECYVSREALEDLARVRESTASERLTIAQEHFDRITDEWGRLLARGRFEPDGTIMLRTCDLTG